MNFNEELDNEFKYLVGSIIEYSKVFSKRDQICIYSWIKKFTEVTSNIEWKKNRNLHCIYLFDMILNEKLRDPYNKQAKNEILPKIDKALVLSRLSKKIKEINFNDKEFNKNNKEGNKDNEEINNLNTNNQLDGLNQNKELIGEYVYKYQINAENIINNNNELFNLEDKLYSLKKCYEELILNN